MSHLDQLKLEKSGQARRTRSALEEYCAAFDWKCQCFATKCLIKPNPETFIICYLFPNEVVLVLPLKLDSPSNELPELLLKRNKELVGIGWGVTKVDEIGIAVHVMLKLPLLQSEFERGILRIIREREQTLLVIEEESQPVADEIMEAEIIDAQMIS